jgi:hypothetical protein
MSQRKRRPRAAVELPKGVHPVTSRGKTYYYFQLGRGTSSAGPRTRLPDDPHSPAFWQALRKAQVAQGVSHVETVDTVAAAIDGYLASAKDHVEKLTLYHYRRSLQIAKDAWGALPVAGIRPAHVAAIMKGLADTRSKANHFLAVMKQFSGWCLTEGLIAQSMIEGVKTFKLDNGHKPWTPEQLAAADKHLTGVVRQGFLLYRYTGQRGQDVVKLGPTHLDEGGFKVKQQKTNREVWCPIVPELAAEMKTWPRRPGPYLRQANGKPYDRRLIWKHFDEQRAKIPELAEVTLHGLRCTAVIDLRRAGLEVPQISDIVGMSLATVQRYCRFADTKESGKAALEILAERRTAKERKL